ncbi:MAG: leucine/isoleucine/valine transporter permease subunit, partial [Actinobacteria bacterium]|nr:leucine/isoleucine/valine transporter permease subunit [Actinomycetota bacterium]
MIGALVMLFVGLLEGLFSEILDNLRLETSWLYKGEGLTISGAVIIFLVAGGIALAWARLKGQVRKSVETLPAPQRKRMRTGALVLVILLLAILPQVVGRFNSNVLGTVGLYVLLGLGLNIVVGYAGLLDLGYVAFFAVGAYTTGVLTSPVSF